MWLDNFEKLIYDFLWRIRAIDEKEIIVLNTRVYEMRSIIFHVIETNNFVDPYVVEYLNILPWMLSITVLRVPVLNRSHKCNELARNDPIEVAIFHALIVFVFFDIKRPEVIPAEPNCIFKAL